MDGTQFDRLGRAIGRKLPRRLLGAPLLAAALSAVGLAPTGLIPAPASADDITPDARRRRCLKTGRRCTRRSGGSGDHCRRCCTGHARRRAGGGGRCACKPSGKTCGRNSECCDGDCMFGLCRACAFDAPTYCSASNMCVNLQNTNDHCGRCDHACDAGTVCERGKCVPT